jgi:lipopolysaccharide export LptBFGC system permease protein LptF
MSQLRSQLNWKKGTYFIAAGAISSLAVAFAASNYLGNSLLNIIVAISVGFGAYRAQDLLKFFKADKEEE